MESKHIDFTKIFVILVMLFNSIFCYDYVQAEEIPADIILLGDSRVAGMGLTLFGLPDTYYTGLSSVDGQTNYAGYNIRAIGLGGWNISSARDVFNNALDGVSNRNATIIYNMGANGLWNVESDIAYLRELRGYWQGAIYVAAVIPVTTACTTITQADVDNFNATMRAYSAEVGFTYIEPSSATTMDFIYAPCDYSYSGKTTWDGLHFTPELYSEWLNDILWQVQTGEIVYEERPVIIEEPVVVEPETAKEDNWKNDVAELVDKLKRNAVKEIIKFQFSIVMN